MTLVTHPSAPFERLLHDVIDMMLLVLTDKASTTYVHKGHGSAKGDKARILKFERGIVRWNRMNKRLVHYLSIQASANWSNCARC